MVEHFQVGKRYRFCDDTYGKYDQLCISVGKTSDGGEFAALETPSKTVFIVQDGSRWSIVPPKPRTGDGFLCVHRKDGRMQVIGVGIPEYTKLTWNSCGWDVFPVKWKEVLTNDKNKAG